MSVLMRNGAEQAPTGLRDRAVRLARQSVPVARTAVPSAAAALQRGTTTTAAWATPHVYTARSWLAPRLEQSGIAVREQLAPVIADAMITASRRVAVEEPRRPRRWPGVAAGIALACAAASAGIGFAVWQRTSNGVTEPRTGDMPTTQPEAGQAAPESESAQAAPESESAQA